jgi:hypothetical protein
MPITPSLRRIPINVKTTVLLYGVGGFTVRKGTRLTVDDTPADAAGSYRVSKGKYRGLLVDGDLLINTETHQYVGAGGGEHYA